MQDAANNTLNILKHHFIMEPKNGYSLLIEVVGSYHIVLVR